MSRIETIGKAKLYLGDCTLILPTLSGFDAIIMDPPYAIPTQVASGRSSTQSVGDLSVIEAAFRVVFDAAANALRPGGRAFVFCGGTSYPVIYRAAYHRFSSALLVWDKGRIGMGREFRKSHELILHLWRDETPIFSDGVGRPDIFRFAPVGQDREHEAQKPVDVIKHLLTVCGERICDPFMGSATTGIAALKTGRSFVGIEIEPKYYDMACSRIAEADRQEEMFAPDNRRLTSALSGK
jgi:site-specific DNA-methyltransferase (adenine-specific)